MKQILFFLLLISSLSNAQVGNFTRAITDSSKNGATTEYTRQLAWKNQEHPLGVIYQKNSWTSTDLTNDFTQTGGITVSVVSNKLQVSGGANTWSQLLKIKGASYLEHVTMCVKVKLGTLSSSSFGFGIGVQTLNGFVDGSGNARFGIVSPATSSKVFLDATGAPFASTNGAVSGSANDYILLTYTKNFPYATLSARNMTTGTASVDSTFGTGGGGNTSNYTIYSFGGTFTIDSISITSPELVNASDLFIGDSKTEGTAATDLMGRYVSLLSPYSRSIVDAGAGGDRTTEILLRMPEIISMHPKRVYMAIGSNDLRSGTSEGTFEANYSSISSQLITAGSTVYYLLPFYETAEDQTTQLNFIKATFPANRIIDTWAPTIVGGRLAADGIHPNNIGHQAIADAIVQSGVLNENRYKPINAYGLMSRVGINVYQKINGVPTLVFTDSVGTGGGGGSPGGSNLQMQYNNSGSFGGVSYATLDNTNLGLVLGDGTSGTRLTLNHAAGLGGNIFFAMAGTPQLAIASSNAATYGGTASTTSGAQINIFDAVSSVSRLGINGLGAFYFGPSNSSYSLAIKQPGPGAKIQIHPAVIPTGSSSDSVLVYHAADSSLYAVAQSSIGGGGGGSPGGSNTQLQYNNSGSFGGQAYAYLDATNQGLVVGAGSVGTRFTLDHGSGFGGNIVFSMAGTPQTFFAGNNLAVYGGTSGATSGRNFYFYDNITSTPWGGLSSLGTYFYGPSNTNYSLAVKQPGPGAKIQIHPAVLPTGTSSDSSLVYHAADSSIYAVAAPVSGQTTLIAGTKTFTVTGATSASVIQVTLLSPNTATSTVMYQGSCTTNSCTIQANLSATTINVADISQVQYTVTRTP